MSELHIDGPFLHQPNAKRLVVWLHGYGASGDDLFVLGRSMANDSMSVWAPNAPIQMPHGGFAWFELSERTQSEYETSLDQTAPLVHAAIQQKATELGVDSVILCGFSQGAMLALHIMAICEPKWPVLAYSGGFFSSQKRNLNNSSACLVHGLKDDVIVSDVMLRSMTLLSQSGVAVEAHMRPHMAHNIDAESARIGERFLRENDKALKLY